MMSIRIKKKPKSHLDKCVIFLTSIRKSPHLTIIELLQVYLIIDHKGQCKLSSENLNTLHFEFDTGTRVLSNQ